MRSCVTQLQTLQLYTYCSSSLYTLHDIYSTDFYTVRSTKRARVYYFLLTVDCTVYSLSDSVVVLSVENLFRKRAYALVHHTGCSDARYVVRMHYAALNRERVSRLAYVARLA